MKIQAIVIAMAVSISAMAHADIIGVECDQYVGDGWVENGYDPDSLDTWRIFLVFDNPSEQLNAVFGNVAHPLSLGAAGGATDFMNTEDLFGAGSLTAPIDQSPMHWENLWDTFVTIDYATSNGGDATMLTPGFAGLVGDLEGAFTLTNGAWAVTIDAVPQGLPGDDGRVMVMQITTEDGLGISGVLNAQIAFGEQFTDLEFSHGIPGPGAAVILAPIVLGRRRRREAC